MKTFMLVLCAATSFAKTKITHEILKAESLKPTHHIEQQSRDEKRKLPPDLVAKSLPVPADACQLIAKLEKNMWERMKKENDCFKARAATPPSMQDQVQDPDPTRWRNQ